MDTHDKELHNIINRVIDSHLNVRDLELTLELLNEFIENQKRYIQIVDESAITNIIDIWRVQDRLYGAIVKYNAPSKSFQVLVPMLQDERDESTLLFENIYLKASHMKVVDHLPLELQDKFETITVPSKLVNKLIPGVELEGTILIPGMQQNEDETPGPKRYSLKVLRREKTVLDELQLVGAHAAYEDEQVVDIHAEGENITFSDRETICEGKIELTRTRFVLHGTVKQISDNSLGFFYPSEEQINVYSLEGSRAYDIIKTLRELQAAKEVRSNVLAEFGAKEMTCSLELLPDHFKEVINSINWKEVYSVLGLGIEGFFNQLRRNAHILDSLSFKDTEEKTKKLNDLKNRGIDRASAHYQGDSSISKLTDIILLRDKFYQISPSSYNSDRNFFFQRFRGCRVRMNITYSLFDKALACAESRIPKSTVDRWRKEYNNNDEGELLCSVCMMEIEDDNLKAEPNRIKLPCGHSFHYDCLTSWLRLNSTCPLCRKDFRK